MEQFFKKKSLGQNFLKSQSALAKIILSSELTQQDIVLEVGPGKGILTEKLLPLVKKVVAVEKDRRLVPFLEEKFKKEIDEKKLEIFEGDILLRDPEEFGLENGQYKIVANIPYYITGKFLRKFLENKNQPRLLTIMVQKEVAERIVAKNGKESILSISVKAYGDPFLVKKIPKGSFSPPPKVDSAILLIKNISKDFFKEFSEENFFKIVKTGFSKKRGQLLGNLSKLFPKEKIYDMFGKIGLKRDIRAEILKLSDWERIAQKMDQKH